MKFHIHVGLEGDRIIEEKINCAFKKEDFNMLFLSAFAKLIASGFAIKPEDNLTLNQFQISFEKDPEPPSAA